LGEDTLLLDKFGDIILSSGGISEARSRIKIINPSER
jgi:hypothetical protein